MLLSNHLKRGATKALAFKSYNPMLKEVAIKIQLQRHVCYYNYSSTSSFDPSNTNTNTNTNTNNIISKPLTYVNAVGKGIGGVKAKATTTHPSINNYIRPFSSSISNNPPIVDHILREKDGDFFSNNNRGEEKNHRDRAFSSLSPDVVQLIRTEFESVDLNNDGKMDSNELKYLLRKHKNIFSEKEILEIAELYYVGNAGKAISFDKLLETIDNILSSTKKESNKNALGVGSCAAEYYYDVDHHQWKEDELDVQLTHVEPKTLSDKIAYNAVKLVRVGFDTFTGWNNEITTKKVLQRVIFLETIAAVPGMTAAIIRHFKSLRNMERDGGLINMFLEEASNERMHLLTFVTMRDPSLMFRACVIGSQFAFGSGFLVAYMANPNFCHRFVGYVEEEACSTYTKIIQAIEEAPEGSDLAQWKTERAPKIGISYWHLGEDGTILDLMYAVRRDEAEHRDVNHEVVAMKPGEVNPRYDPSLRLDQALKTYVREMMTKAPKVST